jgi:hypothetical protein
VWRGVRGNFGASRVRFLVVNAGSGMAAHLWVGIL